MPSTSTSTPPPEAEKAKAAGKSPNREGMYKTYSMLSQLNQIVAGGAAGCITRTVTQPFDVLKIRFQLQVEPVRSTHAGPLSKYTSVLQAIRLIYREEGLAAFWKGHNAGQFMSITYTVVQFWTYEQINLGLSEMGWSSRHPYVLSFVSGGLAGCVGTCVSMPFDVIRTRVVAQDKGSGYRNSIHAVPVILRQEGVSGLFRGLGPTLIQIAPLVGGNFMFYRSLNEIAHKLLHTRQDSGLPTWVRLVTGGIAGVASKAIVYPLDFVKKRLQMRGFETHRQTFGRNQGCVSMMHCVQLTIREEGFLGFYKGMNPTLLKSGMTTAFYFAVYDKFKELLNAWN